MCEVWLLFFFFFFLFLEYLWSVFKLQKTHSEMHQEQVLTGVDSAAAEIRFWHGK